jgi:hypothetical protein
MQRTVTITLVVPDDNSEGVEDVSMKTVFEPPLKDGELSIAAGIVNTILEVYEGQAVPFV